jgi:hypothetical protein
MEINTKYIFPGDDKNQIIEKVNYNFYQVFFNGVGDPGIAGIVGPTGIIGQVGRDGEIGITGDRATVWFFSPDEPSPALSQEDDIWINVGPTGAQQVYTFSGSSWVYSGETLLSGSNFSVVPSLSGPGGAKDQNGIVLSATGPQYTTFVFSDSDQDTQNANPNYAKVVIATDSTKGFPIFGFDKTFIGSPSFPSFNWITTDSSYGIVFSSPGDLQIGSGNTFTLSSTGGTASITASTIVNVESQTTLSLNSGTGGTGNMSFNTPTNTFSANALNGTITPSSFNLQNLTQTSSVTGASSTTLSSTNSGFGLLVNLDNTTGNGITTFKRSNNLEIWESRSNSLNVIGSTGASSGNFVNGVTRFTSNASSTVTYSSGNTVNYLNCSLGISTTDVLITTPMYGTLPSANGRSGRVFLQISASEIFTNDVGRTFDIFLDEANLSFGGIRTVYSGGSQNIRWNDFGTGSTSGCKHVRFQAINSSTAFFQAFTPDTTSYPTCGYIAYSGLVEDGDTGVLGA